MLRLGTGYVRLAALSRLEQKSCTLDRNARTAVAHEQTPTEHRHRAHVARARCACQRGYRLRVASLRVKRVDSRKLPSTQNLALTPT